MSKIAEVKMQLSILQRWKSTDPNVILQYINTKKKCL